MAFAENNDNNNIEQYLFHGVARFWPHQGEPGTPRTSINANTNTPPR